MSAPPGTVRRACPVASPVPPRLPAAPPLRFRGIFKAAVDAGRYDLAIVGVLASVVGAFYYLRVVMQMYVRDPAGEEVPAPLRPSEALAIFAAAAATLWIGFFPSFLLALAHRLA